MSTINLIYDLREKIELLTKQLEEQNKFIEKIIKVNNLQTNEIIIKKLLINDNIPDGYKILSYDEAKRHIDKIKNIIDEWDICQLNKPYLINGSGYGYKLYETNIDDYNSKGHKLIIKID